MTNRICDKEGVHHSQVCTRALILGILPVKRLVSVEKSSPSIHDCGQNSKAQLVHLSHKDRCYLADAFHWSPMALKCLPIIIVERG